MTEPRVGDVLRVRVKSRTGKGVMSAVVVAERDGWHLKVRYTLKDGRRTYAWKQYPRDFEGAT
jgi:hypothetical protein